MLAERFNYLREVAPPSHRAWLKAAHDKVAQFEESFAEWLQALSRFEDSARSRLYKNDAPHPLDLRYHRALLAELIANGENLAIEAFGLLEKALVDEEHVTQHVGLIDQRLVQLTARMHQWHGTLLDQSDVPQSFKDGVKDIAEGKIVEIEKALHDTP